MTTNISGYNNRLNKDRLATIETAIARAIDNGLDGVGNQLHSSSYGRAKLGRDIAELVLAEFRPDLFMSSDPWEAMELVLSTSHVRPETAVKLNLESLPDVNVVAANDYGWWVYVSEDQTLTPEQVEDMPEEFKAIFALARQRGCVYIHFDSDAPATTELPTWEW